MQATVHEFDQTSGEGSMLLDDGRQVSFDGETFRASGLRLLRVGQRLTVTVTQNVQRVTALGLHGV